MSDDKKLSDKIVEEVKEIRKETFDSENCNKGI